MNKLINSITATFKKLAGGSCWKIIILVAILVAVGAFIYYKYFHNKAEQYEDEDELEEDEDDEDGEDGEDNEEIEDFEDDINDDDEDFAGIGDFTDEEMENLGQL